MKKIIFIFLSLILLTSYHKNPKSFDYTIIGKVIGKSKGRICFFESNRSGDEIIIPFKNGNFLYKGNSLDIYSSSLAFYEDYKRGYWKSFPVIIEPGIIEIELNADSIYKKSKVLKGKTNFLIQEINQKLRNYFSFIYNENNTDAEIDSLINIYGDSIKILAKNNIINYGSVYILKNIYQAHILNDSTLNELFLSIKKPTLRKNHDYKLAYSEFLGRTKNYNQVGDKAFEFSLPDSSGNIQAFKTINKDKLVFIEKSGSWCGNLTRKSHELDTIYKKFNPKGFEIVSIVFESKPDRWKKWLKKQNFPWINLLEEEFGKNNNKLFITPLIFANGDYLVNKKGIVVANNLSAPLLYEQLLKYYEPDNYKKFMENKWKVPNGTIILDRDRTINSFGELISLMGNKTFLIDCWASWCSPCLSEFKKNKSLIDFLDKNNIGLVYINFDRNIDEAKWLNIIKKYTLKGYHIRTNNTFVSDFMKNTQWSGQLPTYILVSHKGKNIDILLTRPSETAKFHKEINDILKQ